MILVFDYLMMLISMLDVLKMMILILIREIFKENLLLNTTIHVPVEGGVQIIDFLGYRTTVVVVVMSLDTMVGLIKVYAI